MRRKLEVCKRNKWSHKVDLWERLYWSVEGMERTVELGSIETSPKYTSFPLGGQIILLLKNREGWERV